MSTERLDRLSKVTVEAAWKSLHDRNYNHCIIAGLQVVRPDQTLTGRARTLRFVPYRPDLAARLDADPPMNKQVVESTQPGDVLVVDCFAANHAGFVGDMMLTRFMKLGGRGVIVDGAIRDLGYMRNIELPIYTRHAHSAAMDGRILGIETQVPVAVAGVCVTAGDYLLGDAGGVLVIPAELIDTVLDEAEALDKKEVFIREKIAAGISLHDAYPPNAEIEAEFKRWSNV